MGIKTHSFMATSKMLEKSKKNTYNKEIYQKTSKNVVLPFLL